MYNFTKDLYSEDYAAANGLPISDKNDVSALQDILIKQGYLTAVDKPTGRFLAKTEQALQDYQKHYGIPNTGYFGKMTRAQIAGTAQAAPTLPQPSIDEKGLDLIKEFEGKVLHAYKDQVGVWTIGYGSTYLLDGSRVNAGTLPITEAQATELLRRTVANTYEAGMKKALKRTLNQCQWNALVSFCYNLGASTAAGSPLSDIADKINKGTITRKDWTVYCNAGGKPLAGLIARRNKEADLFGLLN
jgi:lysozyme